MPKRSGARETLGLSEGVARATTSEKESTRQRKENNRQRIDSLSVCIDALSTGWHSQATRWVNHPHLGTGEILAVSRRAGSAVHPADRGDLGISSVDRLPRLFTCEEDIGVLLRSPVPDPCNH